MVKDRYRRAHLDPYLATELRRRYQHGDRSGKLALLASLIAEEGDVPSEIQRLGAADPDPTIGDWLVSNVKHLDDEAKALLLRSDEDDYRHARILEKKAFLFREDEVTSAFVAMSEILRFAMVRSRAVCSLYKFIGELFNFESKNLPIEPGQRERLIVAFLANPHLASGRKMLSPGGSATKVHETIPDEIRYRVMADDVSTKGDAARGFSQAWSLVLAWPDKYHAIKKQALQYLPATDEDRAAAYRSLDNKSFRWAILWGCDASHIATLKVAMEDREEELRKYANWLAKADQKEEKFKEAIAEIKKHAASGEKRASRLRVWAFWLSPVNYLLLALALKFYWSWFIRPAVNGMEMSLIAALGVVVILRVLLPVDVQVDRLAAMMRGVFGGIWLIYGTMTWLGTVSRKNRRHEPSGGWLFKYLPKGQIAALQYGREQVELFLSKDPFKGVGVDAAIDEARLFRTVTITLLIAFGWGLHCVAAFVPWF